MHAFPNRTIFLNQTTCFSMICDHRLYYRNHLRMSKLLCHWQVHVLPDRHCCSYFSNTTFHKIGLVTKKPFHVGNALFIPRFAMMMRSILKHSPPVTWRCHSMSGSEALVGIKLHVAWTEASTGIIPVSFSSESLPNTLFSDIVPAVV